MIELVGLLLGFGIGAACRWFDIPLPAPPRIVGALLVVSMTVGFTVADLVVSRAGAAEALITVPAAVATCRACHGTDGQSLQADAPHLSAQLPEYLALQLRNYQSGERKHPVMQAMTATLTAEQIDALARYYSAQPAKAGTSKNPDQLALGKRIFDRGNVGNGVAACAWCHGATGAGLSPAFPRIASQNPDYVLSMLQTFHRIDDFKNPYAWVMKAAVVRLSDNEAAAAAEYLTTLP